MPNSKEESHVQFSALLILTVIVALLAFGTVANAQTITGSISGAVTDSTGGMIPGATVTLTSEKTGQSRGSTTDSEGRFNFAALQPGTYALKVERQGFQTLEQRGVILSANENLALGDLKLQPGQVSETVSVMSEGAIVERESSDLTARLTADQINLISTKGRDVTSLLRLLPGTSNNDDIEGAGDGFGTDLPNISGQRGRSTVPTIDGLFAGEPSGSNKLSMTINQDAVAEVKVLRNNYGAEYGNNGGAIINIVSKGRRQRLRRFGLLLPAQRIAQRHAVLQQQSGLEETALSSPLSGWQRRVVQCGCRNLVKAATSG